MSQQPDFIELLKRAIPEVFHVVGGMDVIHRDTSVTQDHAVEQPFCSVLDFSGNIKGYAMLCMPRELLARISCRATGYTANELSDAVFSDTVSELTNQIVGLVQSQVSRSGFGFSLGTPRAVQPAGERVSILKDRPCVRLDFETADGFFSFFLCRESPDDVAVCRPETDVLEFDPEMQDIVDGFVVETGEILDTLDQDLVRLDDSPEDKELVNSVFRAFHTMKGNSLALGLEKLNTLVHRTEDIIRKVRDGEMTVSREMMDVVFASVDLIKELVQDVKARKKSRQDLAPMIGRLAAVLETNAGSGPGKLEFDEEMREIVDGFVVETEEILEKLDHDLVRLDETPDNFDLVNSVFRAFHTMKGNSGALGFETLQKLVHRTEDIFRKVRDQGTKVTSEMMDVVLRSVDIVKKMIGDIKKRVVSTVDLTDILQELGLVFEEKYDELGVRREQSKKPAPAAPEQAKTASTTVRVDINKLDQLLNVTGELVLNRNSLLNLIQNIEQGTVTGNVDEPLNEIFARISILVAELQSSVMATRMQPVSKVFSKYPRVVRDLSREMGKEIELVITGENTELDNTIIEEIADPLVHLVRNSCDHGIEMPDDRRAKGKNPRGRVDLMAYQEGSFVVIEIRDDGKGMDPEVLKRKALEKGLVSVEQAGSMARGDILNLIFMPGFSTAEKVTAVSGRGVGMDVVKTNIGRLNGIIDLDSEKEAGSRVKIRLPLTLAVTIGLEVEIGSERYLIPQESVVEIVRVASQAYDIVLKEKKFLFRNQYWNPLVDLKEVLHAKVNGRSRPEKAYIVVVGEAEQRAGVLVDNVLQQHEVVIKPLGRYIGNYSLPYTSGATIMGDGGVELILNPSYLLAMSAGMKAEMNA